MNFKILGATVVVSLIAGALLYRHFAPSVEVTKEVVKDRIITVTHTVVTPDGTTTTDSTTTEKHDQTSVAKTVPKQLDWAAGLNYNTNQQYSADLARRVLGPVFVVIGIDQAGTASLGLRVDF